MKSSFLALTAAAALVLTGSSAALADPSGFLSLGLGPDHYSSDYGMGDETFDGTTVQGRTSGVYDFTPVLGVQGDVVLNFDKTSFELDDSERRSVDVALHGFYRETDKFLFGTFIQFGRDGLYYNGTHEVDVNRAYVGAEAQVYIDNLTLYAQGGMQQYDIEENGAPNFDGWFGNVEARYFLTPDFRIDAHAGLSTLSFGSDVYSQNTLNLGIGAEYKFENSPFSLFAKYDYVNTTFNGSGPDGSVDEHRFLVGATFAMGVDSLLSRDRSGPPLDPVPPRAFSLGFAN